VDWIQPGALPAWVETPTDFAVQAWDNGRRLTVCLTNLSYDPTKELVLHLPASVPTGQAWTLTPAGRRRRLGKEFELLSAGPVMNTWKLKLELTAFISQVLIFERP